MRRGIPEDVAAINQVIREFLNTKDENNRLIGQALGIYAFFDYDEDRTYARTIVSDGRLSCWTK
jgi:hypothetical protein